MNKISLRFNEKEEERLEKLLIKHDIKIKKSSFLKRLMFAEVKPFLRVEEWELLALYLYELHKIGVNMNQGMHLLNTLNKISNKCI